MSPRNLLVADLRRTLPTPPNSCNRRLFLTFSNFHTLGATEHSISEQLSWYRLTS